MKDNINNKEFNTLVPDDPAYTGKDKKGKFGAALLRNVFANVAAFEVQMPDTMLDFLQGRSQKSGAETRSKTAKSGYLVRPRGTFYPAERDAAQTVGNWFDEVEGISVVDRFDPATQTVTKTSYGIPGMFDQPVATAVPDAAQPVTAEKPAPASLSDLSPETLDAMEKGGWKIDKDKLFGAIDKIPGPIKKSIPIAGIGLSTLAAQDTFASVKQEASKVGLPEPVSTAVGAVAGATEFLPVAPSDVIAAGQSMASPQPDLGSARPIERIMAEQQNNPESFLSTQPQ